MTFCLFRWDCNEATAEKTKEEDSLMSWWNGVVRRSGVSEKDRKSLERIVSESRGEKEAVNAICDFVDSHVESERNVVEKKEDTVEVSQKNADIYREKKDSSTEREKNKESLVTAALMVVKHLKSRDKPEDQEAPDWLLPEDRVEVAYPIEKASSTASSFTLLRRRKFFGSKKKKQDVDELWRWQFLAQMMPISDTSQELRYFFERRLHALANRNDEILAVDECGRTLLWIAVKKNDEFATIALLDTIAKSCSPDAFLAWLGRTDTVKQLSPLGLARSKKKTKRIAYLIESKEADIKRMRTEALRPISQDVGDQMTNYQFAKAHNPLLAWCSQKFSHGANTTRKARTRHAKIPRRSK